MTVKQYHFRNGLVLAISDTTLKKMIDSGEADTVLISTTPIVGRGTFLLEFERVDEKKTVFFWVAGYQGSILRKVFSMIG